MLMPRRKTTPKRRLTDAMLEDFIKDEKLGKKKYQKYGFRSQAKDEGKHAKYFLKKYRQMEKAEKRKRK